MENSKRFSIQEYWEGVENYATEIPSLWHGPGSSSLRERVMQAVESSMIVGDLGCGPGFFLTDLSQANNIYAVDFSDNMLSQARTRAPENTTFIKSDLRHLQLETKLDFAICFNSIMPDCHTDALVIISNVLKSVREGGELIIVVPSFESRLYALNMWHFQSAEQGLELEHLSERMDAFVNYYNNPLGYIKLRTGVIMKNWLEQEIVYICRHLRPCKSISTFKVNRNWEDNGFKQFPWKDVQPPWAWGISINY